MKTLSDICQDVTAAWRSGGYSDQLRDAFLGEAALTCSQLAVLHISAAADRATPENWNDLLKWSEQFPANVCRQFVEEITPTLDLMLCSEREQLEPTKTLAIETFWRCHRELTNRVIVTGGRA